jgi:hypothetical protein
MVEGVEGLETGQGLKRGERRGRGDAQRGTRGNNWKTAMIETREHATTWRTLKVLRALRISRGFLMFCASKPIEGLGCGGGSQWAVTPAGVEIRFLLHLCGGVAARNHRLIAVIPAGCGAGVAMGTEKEC